MIIALVIILILIIAVVAFYRHQCLLRDRAQLMCDAMRHRDFSFRLPTSGMPFGEKALQNTLNDAGHEIEKLVAHKEVEAWQRLTRVLTHEIMNVITPIRSITQAYLADPQIKCSRYEEGIQAIHDASAGLAMFVSNYREMTRLHAPVIKDVSLGTFCESIAALYPDLNWEINVPLQLRLRADENLLRQVFVNLVKNAVEADATSIGIRYVGSAHIHSLSSSGAGKLLISNDGHVIPDDVAREIFIPFFTTKPHGSGIGLSLSRQILLMQGMILCLADNPVKGYNVTFVLENDK